MGRGIASLATPATLTASILSIERLANASCSNLACLLSATERLAEDDGGDADDLRLLLAPGSSLGGAIAPPRLLHRPERAGPAVRAWRGVAAAALLYLAVPSPAQAG
jgi:hypothetical protein